MFSLTLISVLYFFSTSCGGHSSNEKRGSHRKTELLIDTIKKDIPKWYLADTLLQERIKNENKMLKIPDLQLGFNDLQIRISINCSIEDSQHLIIFNKYKSDWKALFYSYNYVRDQKGSVISIASRIEERFPKSGWQIFSTNLLTTGIEQLQDYQKFRPDYTYPTDANAVTVEVATPSTYRLYQYPALEANKKIKAGPAKLEEALLLIEKEFSYIRACH